MLGLGGKLTKQGMPVVSHITDNLKMLHRYNAGSVVPVSDGAVDLDGSGDFISIPDSATFHHDNSSASLFTVSCWVKITGSTTDSDTFISKYDYGANKREWRLSLDGSGYFECVVSANGTNSYSAATTDALDTNWNHLVFAYDGSQGTANNRWIIYVNGALKSLTYGGTAPAQVNEDDSPVVIGGMLNSGSLSGTPPIYTCNVGIWSAVLTQPQIKSIMFKNYAGLTDSEKTNLVSWYNLDEGAGTTATDSHGSNNGSATFT